MKIIHLTDPHLRPKDEAYFNLDHHRRLDACLADIEAGHADADLVILTGDLVHGGTVEGYRTLKDRLDRFGPPWRLMMGNHDDRDNFRLVFGPGRCDAYGYVQWTDRTPLGLFIFLDTKARDGGPKGELGSQRQAWLKARLDEAAAEPVYVFLHHPPFATGIKALDKSCLVQSGELARILAGHGQVRHLFVGHVHGPMAGSWREFPFTTMPAVGPQISLELDGRDRLAFNSGRPGYGIILLDQDQVVVHTHFIGEKVESLRV